MWNIASLRLAEGCQNYNFAQSMTVFIHNLSFSSFSLVIHVHDLHRSEQTSSLSTCMYQQITPDYYLINRREWYWLSTNVILNCSNYTRIKLIHNCEHSYYMLDKEILVSIIMSKKGGFGEINWCGTLKTLNVFVHFPIDQDGSDTMPAIVWSK